MSKDFHEDFHEEMARINKESAEEMGRITAEFEALDQEFEDIDRELQRRIEIANKKMRFWSWLSAIFIILLALSVFALTYEKLRNG